jgi:hypothetical protein
VQAASIAVDAMRMLLVKAGFPFWIMHIALPKAWAARQSFFDEVRTMAC